VSRMNWVILLVCAVSLFQPVRAASGGRNKEVPPPQVYTERAKELLDSISSDSVMDKESPFTAEQMLEIKELLRTKDEFLYSQPKTLIVKNKVIKVSLRDRKIIHIKLGHTYNTTLVFTDTMGNPWDVDTLTNMSNSSVVSYYRPAPHIITVRPLKASGQTNLPIKPSGEQNPLTLLFDINDKEVYFNADIKIDGLGNSIASQSKLSMDQLSSGKRVLPKLSAEPAKEKMLQFLTPKGYVSRDLYDEYGERLDSRDFMAWSYKDKLFVMTPHYHYTPEPVDISAASDGRHRLYEFSNVSVLLMRKNSQIIMMHIK
jgi:hypothetical protein